MSLQSEIHEQPVVLQALLENQMGTVENIARAIRSADPRYVFLAARGTSDNAGRYANYLWGAMNQLPIALATPSLFTYYQQPPRFNGALVVGISQSGKSPDIVSVLEEGRRQGCPTLAVTNEPDSPLANAADFIIPIQAGEEKAVAATKTYTAELMALAMLSAALRQDDEMKAVLKQVPGWLNETLQREEQIARSAERYRYMGHCVVIGRGYNYATAFEWALKIKELTYVVAEPYSNADFQHGPVAMVERGFPVMVIAPSGKVHDNLVSFLRPLRDVHHAELMIISDRPEALSLAQTGISIPSGIPEWISPLVCVIPGQLFAANLARVKGWDTENPRTIQKVTETH